MRVKDFKTGDRVRHISRNQIGIVKMCKDRMAIEVDFAKPGAGRPDFGLYDSDWMKQYGHLLEKVDA